MKAKASFTIPTIEDLNTQAYLLESPHFKGRGHEFCVDYAHGTGILSALTVAVHRSHWIYHDKEKGWQLAKIKEGKKIFTPLLQFFQDKRKAKITEIDPEEAEKLLDRMRKDPKSFLPKAEKEEVKTEEEKESEPKAEPLPHEKEEKKSKEKKKDKE